MSVKNTYNDFITHVSKGRNMTLQEVDEIGQGRVWTGLRGEKNWHCRFIRWFNSSYRNSSKKISRD